MEFNPEIYEGAHYETTNTARKYIISGRALVSFEKQSDLGVHVQGYLKAGVQVD